MIITFSRTVKGNSTPHTHLVNELIVATKGNALLCANGESHRIHSDQTILVPAGVTHHYEIFGTLDAAQAVFICFDELPIKAFFSPELQTKLKSLFSTQVSTALVNATVAQENAALAGILKRCVEEEDTHLQDKAGNILRTILLNHLSAVEPPKLKRQSAKFDAMRKTLLWIENHLAEEISVDIAAAKSNMSRSSFTRHFKQYTELSFSHYLRNIRLKRALSLLEKENMPVCEIAFHCGYKNLGHFYSQFQEQYEMTPKQYRKVCDEMSLTELGETPSAVQAARDSLPGRDTTLRPSAL